MKFFSFRKAWYAVLIWIIAFLTSGIVLAPWFYIVLPLLVLLLTVYYLDWGNLKKSTKRDRDAIVKFGLAGAIFWFVGVSILSLLELAGFYYFDFGFYFSDVKNIFLFPMVLLIPAVYSLVLSNKRSKRSKHNKRLIKTLW